MCLTHQTPVIIFNIRLTSLPCNDIWKHVHSLIVFDHKRNDMDQKIFTGLFHSPTEDFPQTSLIIVAELFPRFFNIFPGFFYPSL